MKGKIPLSEDSGRNDRREFLGNLSGALGSKVSRNDKTSGQQTNMKAKNPWQDEEAYGSYLERERELFAWCLETYGSFDKKTAREEAEKFYYYESSDDESRGLVFHDEAWHWAMLGIFGNAYWKSHPELEKPSADYRMMAKD
jgi:hypothetical protein